jgi:hypothetical protein
MSQNYQSKATLFVRTLDHKDGVIVDLTLYDGGLDDGPWIGMADVAESQDEVLALVQRMLDESEMSIDEMAIVVVEDYDDLARWALGQKERNYTAV